MTKTEIDTAVDSFYDTGKVVAVGARYGKAPDCGKSYNYATNTYESGISLMQVNDLPGVHSFAVAGALDRKLCYYVGTVVKTTGGDDEFLMTDAKPITKAQYTRFVKSPEGKLSSLVLAFWQSDTMGRLGISHTYPKIWQRWEDAYQQKLQEVANAK